MKRERAELLEKKHPKLSQRTQCQLLDVCRSSLRSQKAPWKGEDPPAMQAMDCICLRDPCIRSRRLPEALLRDYGLRVERKRIQRLGRKMGLETIWYRPRRTSVPEKSHRKYPCLLRDLEVRHPDQVWCADITYVRMPSGHAYLCAVVDWFLRKVLGWRASNTKDAWLCLGVLSDAVESSAGRLWEIFNTDQGSQFTSEMWTGRLEELGIAASMDGKGRWMDNVFIERLSRKSTCVNTRCFRN